MALDDLDPDNIEEDAPDLQAFIFPNPHDEKMGKYVQRPEKAERFYLDARWLKNRLGSSAEVIVGEFIEAIRKAEEDDDYEQLENIVDTLKGEDDA